MIARILSASCVILWALGFALFALTLPRPADDRLTDAIVVLTGGAGPARSRRSICLPGTARGGCSSRAPIAPCARASLRRARMQPLALFDCCVDLGQESVDTRSNAIETARWLRAHHYRSVRLITTDWHMPRAHADLARALGRHPHR